MAFGLFAPKEEVDGRIYVPGSEKFDVLLNEFESCVSDAVRRRQQAVNLQLQYAERSSKVSGTELGTISPQFAFTKNSFDDFQVGLMVSSAQRAIMSARQVSGNTNMYAALFNAPAASRMPTTLTVTVNGMPFVAPAPASNSRIVPGVR